jgi:hypothetical protein
MDRPGGPGPLGCAILRAHEPRDAHEYALVAQLKEFYSDDPSNERIRSIARKVAEATDDERRFRPRCTGSGPARSTWAKRSFWAFFGSVGAGRYRDLRFVAKKKHDSLKKRKKEKKKKRKNKK